MNFLVGSTRRVCLGLAPCLSALSVPAHYNYHFDNAHEQQHQLFPTLDLNFSPDWEFNFGVGFGLTRRTDDLMVKLIVGRRF